MEELAWLRRLVDRGEERLSETPPNHPLRSLERSDLRRRLAEAAIHEMRQLRDEIEQDAAPEAPPSPASDDEPR